MKNSELPAFPILYDGKAFDGLTKREYLAGLAMQSLATDVRGNPEHVAKQAVEHADALLKQLQTTKN